jgi:hypothetical protein
MMEIVQSPKSEDRGQKPCVQTTLCLCALVVNNVRWEMDEVFSSFQCVFSYSLTVYSSLLYQNLVKSC